MARRCGPLPTWRSTSTASSAPRNSAGRIWTAKTRPSTSGSSTGGKASLPGEWDAKVLYQSVGAFALDTNLVDSDLFDSRTNMKGWVFSGNYALGAATQFSLTLAQGKRKNDSVIAPGSGDVGANNALDKFWVLQADLNVKF